VLPASIRNGHGERRYDPRCLCRIDCRHCNHDLHASRGATLIYNGLQDTTVSMTTHGPEFFADVHWRTAALRGSEKGVFEYELDRLSASEDREGGTHAIGTGVPVPSRSDLSVLSPSEWQKQKNHLIYEARLKAARAQLR
jgi:hypothetical protein